MATVTMPCTDQEMPHAGDHEAGTRREDTQDMKTQGMDKPIVDAMLNDCCVEMVPLDDIYVESDQQDEELVKALAHSISLIGLQNPICVIANDIEGHPAPYRLVSGRKRYAAFLHLAQQKIPAHILSYAETDSHKDLRTSLATTEENLVRKHYSLIELCELVGQSKDMYERMHPDTIHGKASKKKKDSGTESFRPLPYLAVAAQQLGKSRATIWKYLCIYNHLVQGHPAAFAELKKCDHPILSKLEELQELAKSQDLATLTRLMCGEGMLPGDRKHQPCTFQDARTRLAQYRAKEAREKDQSQVQGKGNAGEELPPQPPETPSHSSTLPAPTSSSALEMSAPQPPDSTTTPPPEGGSVATSPPETPACVDPLPDEALDTVEDVLRALDEQINTYLRAMNLFNVFHIGIEKTSNEIHVTVQERA